jgi:RNA polymerase sigma-70 factor (ECF subfamily)
LLKQNEKPESALLNALEFEKLQSGDQAVFKKVYDAHFGLVVFMVKRCGVSHDEALDIVQDSFIKLYKKANQIQSQNTLKSWLVTTARNQAMDHLRKQKLVAKHAEKERLNQGHDVEVGNGLVSDEQLHELQLVVLGELIEDIQNETNDNTFTLFYRDGMSVKAIAKRQGEPISTITNRLSRLRKRFRDKFETHLKNLHDSVY